MPKLKAILFDMDGVIVDSHEANIEFYIRLLAKAGYALTREKVQSCYHLTLREVIKHLTQSTNPDEIERLWKLGQNKSIYPVELLTFPESLTSVLENLHKQYRLAIVTGRLKGGAQDIFDAVNIAPYFEVVITADDYTNPKPHPEPIQVALIGLGLRPDEAVYIGDTRTDTEAAKAASMASIHLGPEKHNDATICISDFSQLIDAIMQLEELDKRQHPQ